MATHAELMRQLIDEIYGTGEPVKHSITPPNTTGIGIALHESNLNKPNPGMPYPSFMHELVSRHPEIREVVKIFPYKDRSGWLIKPKGDSIDNATIITIRDACLERGCKLSKTSDGNLDVSKSSPISPEDESSEWMLSVGSKEEPENIIQVMHDLEDLIGKTVTCEDHSNGWSLIWAFPSQEEAIEAKEFVHSKFPNFQFGITQGYPNATESN